MAIGRLSCRTKKIQNQIAVSQILNLNKEGTMKKPIVICLMLSAFINLTAVAGTNVNSSKSNTSENIAPTLAQPRANVTPSRNLGSVLIFPKVENAPSANSKSGTDWVITMPTKNW